MLLACRALRFRLLGGCERVLLGFAHGRSRLVALLDLVVNAPLELRAARAWVMTTRATG